MIAELMYVLLRILSPRSVSMDSASLGSGSMDFEPEGSASMDSG